MAMKEAADLSLSQLRIMWHFFKVTSWQMESETKERDIVKTLTDDNITQKYQNL